jgi:hypothetical protein
MHFSSTSSYNYPISKYLTIDFMSKNSQDKISKVSLINHNSRERKREIKQISANCVDASDWKQAGVWGDEKTHKFVLT